MLLSLLRWLRGYVLFCVNGRFPERFVNITSRRGIRLWCVVRHGDDLTAAMHMSDYRRIRPVARSCRVRLQLLSKHGLPVHMRRYRRRAGLAVGVFAFLLTVFVMSQFIWCVDITGLDTIAEYQMRDLLRAHGMYVGACRIGMDYPGVSRAVMLDDERVGWMAVNVSGSYASVEIKEETAAPEVTDIHTPCNVKASRDGTIIRIDAGEGEILLKEGSGVVGGQLVVSGVMDDAQGGVRLVHADAHILAEVRDSVTFSVPERAAVLLPDGETGERRSLSLFGISVPVSFMAAQSPYTAVNTSRESPVPLGVSLPVSVIREHIQGLEEQEVIRDNNSAKELLTKRARLYEVFCLDGVVTDRRVRMTRRNGVYTLTAEYLSQQDIAVQSPIGTE